MIDLKWYVSGEDCMYLYLMGRIWSRISSSERERDKWFEDRDDGMIPGELSMVVEVRSWVIRDVLRSQVMRLTVLRFLTWSDGLYHGDWELKTKRDINFSQLDPFWVFKSEGRWWHPPPLTLRSEPAMIIRLTNTLKSISNLIIHLQNHHSPILFISSTYRSEFYYSTLPLQSPIKETFGEWRISKYSIHHQSSPIKRRRWNLSHHSTPLHPHPHSKPSKYTWYPSPKPRW